MSELIPRIKNLVCLYKLFKQVCSYLSTFIYFQIQVVIDTEACKAAFDCKSLNITCNLLFCFLIDVMPNMPKQLPKN